MVEIHDELITHIATLARLSLTAEETRSIAHDLKKILEYASTLEGLDLEGIPPMSHPGDDETFRPDEAKHDLSRDDALQNAPDQEAGLFRVPQVIGG